MTSKGVCFDNRLWRTSISKTVQFVVHVRGFNRSQDLFVPESELLKGNQPDN